AILPTLGCFVLEMGFYDINWPLKWQLLCCLFLCWNLASGSIFYSVPEGLQPGAFVGNIAQDLGLDAKQFSARSFRILPGPGKQYLDVNLDNGILLVKEKIDREGLCGASPTCALSFEAVIENPFNLYDIEVEIVDVNDNAPRFPKSQFRLEISELAAPGARFPLEGAQDSDVGTNSVQTYQLVANEYFSLNVQGESGDVKLPVLVLERRLDREQQPTHRLVLIAEDGGTPERSGTSQFRLEISEVATPGSRFPLECAHDPDVGINSLQTYRLVDDQYFTLNIQTRTVDGKLPVLVLEKPLDREQQPTHRLVLIAEDGGTPERSGTVEIFINVQDANDNAPVFTDSVYTVSLLENTPRGTLVIRVNATDLDDGNNGEIVYSFSGYTSAKVREIFTVDSKTGEIRVKGNLDYEEFNVFEINIEAIDRGLYAIPAYCNVLVNIIDVNDNSPEVTLNSLFSPIREDSLPGTVVALISAGDKDSGEYGQVQCQIPHNLPFKLDLSSRKYFRLLTQGTLDRETASEYDVTVVCSDRGTPPLTSNLTIRVELSDINDNAPRFAQPLYREHVMENNAVGTSMFSVSAFDPDFNQNGRLTYSIPESQVRAESVSTYVYINSENGIIYSRRSFDFEQMKSFQFTVQAQDNGSPPLTSNASVDVTIVDQNDNAPVIVSPLPEFGSTVTETVSRLAEPGYLVAKVSAIDADTGQNGRLSYQIVQATDPGLFTISPDTGEIWTIRSVVSKDADQQRLVIVVKDNGNPSLSATVTIILSIEGRDTEMLSDASGLSEDPWLTSDVSIYLVISLGITSSVFLVVLILLALKASRNIHIPQNYVEVFGGDPLSQSFRYDSCSTSDSTKGDFMFASGRRNNSRSETTGKEGTLRPENPSNYRIAVNSEVRHFQG
uniref:Protocadherin gamma-C3 n=1 Tax=Callorhinchus milii TaxID=7868 RepID=A0A4W3KA26_CALMI